jgi:hypothetical protein
MAIEILEVVKEYLMNVLGVKQAVKARISHGELSNFYRWEISHYHRPENAADLHLPSNVHLHTLSECESTLFSYMRKFTDKVEVNEDY